MNAHIITPLEARRVPVVQLIPHNLTEVEQLERIYETQNEYVVGVGTDAHTGRITHLEIAVTERKRGE